MRARLAATLLAALACFALLLQLFLSLRNAPGIAHGLLMYSGYFTVLTNLLVAIVATVAARRADGGLDLRWRGCAVAAIVVVGLGYQLLLRTAWDPQGWQKVADIALHYAVPLGGLLWWLGLAIARALAPAHDRLSGIQPYSASNSPSAWSSSVRNCICARPMSATRPASA